MTGVRFWDVCLQSYSFVAVFKRKTHGRRTVMANIAPIQVSNVLILQRAFQMRGYVKIYFNQSQIVS